MDILRNVFSLKNKKENNGKIYKIITIFGLKIKILNIRRTLVETSQETKLLRTIIEKSIDITKIPKATGNLRKVQLIKTKIVEIIDIILKKHNVQYWIDFGTLIGAIRHKGFIPWDDDIDLCIMKDDYLKLPEIFDKELANKGFKLSYCDSVGSNLIRFIYDKYRIDFFPMEYLNKTCLTEEEKTNFVRNWFLLRDKFLKKYSVKELILGKCNLFEMIQYADILKQNFFRESYEERSETCQFIRSFESMAASELKECAVFDNEYVFPLQNLQFEDLSLPAPIDPLQHLYQSGEYGDYGEVMNFPTINDSGFYHTQIKYSSEEDYNKILQELANILEKIKNENNIYTIDN